MQQLLQCGVALCEVSDSSNTFVPTGVKLLQMAGWMYYIQYEHLFFIFGVVIPFLKPPQDQGQGEELPS